MANESFAINWQPSNKAEAEAWLTYESYERTKVAKSKFADEAIIRQIASHSWGPNDGGDSTLPALAENPNLTPDLTEWLDAKSASWSLQAQHVYWLTRYGVDQRNSNYTQGEEKQGPTRSFPEKFINSKLESKDACQSALELADHFLEHMWHDLARQKHLDLTYVNEYRGAYFGPPDTGATSEEIIRFFSPGYFVTWISKEESFDFDWASERAQDDDGKWHFEEKTYADYLDDDPFCGPNLGYAIGAGLQANDLKLLDRDRFEEYLEEFHDGDSEMYEVTISIVKESPWLGKRYGDISDNQKMNLALNLIATLDHPYLGRSDGISVYLLECLAKHDQTPDNVKALIILQLTK